MYKRISIATHEEWKKDEKGLCVAGCEDVNASQLVHKPFCLSSAYSAMVQHPANSFKTQDSFDFSELMKVHEYPLVSSNMAGWNMDDRNQ